MKILERTLLILLILSISISIYFTITKASIEQENNQVEISVPLNEVSMLSKGLGMKEEDVLRHLKSSGITSLVIEDINLKQLEQTGHALILNGWQILDHKRFLGIDIKDISFLAKENFDAKSYYIFLKDNTIYENLRDFMLARDYEIKTYKSNDIFIIQEVLGEGGFSDIGLGFRKESLQLAKDLDLLPVAVSKSLSKKSPEEMQFIINSIADENISIFIPHNNELPEDERAKDVLIKYLNDENIILGVDEFVDSKKLSNIAQEIGHRSIRVYNRPLHGYIEEFLFAVRDRNDRLLCTHLFLSGKENLLTYNLKHIAKVKDAIYHGGIINSFIPDKALPFRNFKPNRYLSFLAALGFLWLVWNMLKLLGFSAKVNISAIIIVFGVFLGLALKKFVTFRDVAGLLIAVGFPVYSIYQAMKSDDSINKAKFSDVFYASIKGFLTATLFALIGAILLQGLFADPNVLLGYEKFRGIKALYIFSYIAIISLYLKDKNGGISLTKPIISLGGILLLGIFTGIMYILLNRTGNYSVVPIPKWELAFRAWLEKVLWVRPRTKEFLIGFPALFLAEGLKHMNFGSLSKFFYIVALIGLVSMVNTFSHFHISILISLIRSLEGVFLGIVIGAGVLGGFYLYEKRGKSDA